MSEYMDEKKVEALSQKLMKKYKLQDSTDTTNITNKTDDPVNNPSHYNTGKFECIDVMIETQGINAVMDFCLCNAFKYLYRHNGKNGLEDIKKAQYYINKYIELYDKSNGGGGSNDISM